MNTIIRGDLIEEMEILPENCAQLVYADPPYNLSGNGLEWKGNETGGDWFMVNEDWDKMSEDDYFIFTYEWIKRAKRLLKENGSIFISCTYHNLGEALSSLKRLDFKINNVITWYKTNSMPNMTKRTLTHACEYVIWATAGSNWVFNYETSKTINPEKRKDGKDKQMRDMWRMPLCQGKERVKNDSGRAAHPTQKPEELLKRIILIGSEEEDLIIDPFFGLGTTGVVAKRYNRNWIGIEKNEEYVKLAKERIRKVEPEKTEKMVEAK
jgi:site-specific DNA-methyltransferase (adenine-specific)/modification methylase